MASSGSPSDKRKARAPAIFAARRDALVLGILITAVLLLIWNGSAFFRQVSFAGAPFGPDVKLASTALTLNVALILFGWRRYADIQHEAELRADGERRAALLATTDAHTGLLNRKGFADRVQEICSAAIASGASIAIISLQIQRFKPINDRHGYEVGDSLLRILADAMTAVPGPDAAVARLSGDEFAVALAVGASESDRVERIAEDLLRSVTAPVMIDERLIQVGAFAGIGLSPAEETRVPDLLRRADIAMDHAKSGRVARPVWFDAAMERALIAQTEIEQGIRFGLEHDQFVPYFEPQVDLETGEIVGFEVLARWIHPLSGVIEPDAFIPVAEEIGVIGPLSEKVIRGALAEAAAWPHRLKISVNIAPSQLADPWLAERLVMLCTETGFAPNRLVVEITESSLLTDLELARSIVTSLKNQGVRLALDDFGTGFSSLAHLRALPFDVIKVDRSFVSNIHSNPESLAIVRAVTALASALRVTVCAEGIEDEPAHSTLLRLGCAVGQGWYFGKPMSGEQARGLLHQATGAAPEARASAAY